MKYLQVTIFTSEYAIEEVTGLLLSMGICETVVDDPQTAIDSLEKKNDYEEIFIHIECCIAVVWRRIHLLRQLG